MLGSHAFWRTRTVDISLDQLATLQHHIVHVVHKNTNIIFYSSLPCHIVFNFITCKALIRLDFRLQYCTDTVLVIYNNILRSIPIRSSSTSTSGSFFFVQTTGKKEFSEASTNVFVHLFAIVLDLIRNQETFHSLGSIGGHPPGF